MNIGTKFEQDLSKEFGIRTTPGSGATWHSKLDLVGRGARWSLKATEKRSISISQDVIDEAVIACESASGAGETPLWAFRIGGEEYDMVMLRKDDFKSLQAGELNVIDRAVDKKLEDRRRRSSMPGLLRDDN